MDKKQSRVGVHFYIFFACIVITPFLTGGCSQGFLAGSNFKEANDFFSQGNYQTSLRIYEQTIEEYPAAGDKALFEMGIIYSYPDNEQKDYQKSLECFQRLLKDYPNSQYRQNSAEMISHLNNVSMRDKRLFTQQKQIAILEQELKSKKSEIAALQKKIEELEQEVFAIRKGPVNKILIEKKERRLSLISKDKVLKKYKIALGGNPNGPKEKRGDNKTPEGTYIIDSKIRDSRYHLSLHISYPNEQDKKRAKELGVSPGGDIMIHGLKNGFSWIGDLHRDYDWTKGCIAVTDEEIEEIAKLVPNGTVVEIKP